MWQHGRVSRRRILGLGAVALVAVVAGLVVRGNGTLNRLERSSVDTRFSLRGRQSPAPGVVVVGIDNESLGKLPRYPFPRDLDARVLDELRGAGARLIVYDISFDRPTNPHADLALFDAAKRAAPVVFATSLISPSGATQVLGGNANLASIGARPAAANLAPDGDGVLRHLLDQVNGLPTVAAAVTATTTGRTRSDPQLHGGWIDFRGATGTVRRLSFLSVLRGRFDLREVKGKVVVIGATAPVLQDLHDTSVGGPMPGPEVQAQAISTALRGFPLRSASSTANVAMIVLLALLVPLAAFWFGTLGCALVAVLFLCLWSVAAQLAFNHGTVLDFSDPLATLVVSSGGTLILTTWSERRERRRLRSLFAADATSVVERVLHSSGPRPLEPTAVIAGYRIEEVVGRGGMGVVYRATQLELNRTVAIKLIATERAADPIFRERFKLESRVAASVDHANVIPVYEAGEDDGLLFIAMRLVDGVDLAQLLGTLGPLEPEMALRIVEQLAGALDAAHAKGLVHRDVKPANVLLTAEKPEHVYLTDFGLAKSIGAGSSITRTDQWVGTLDYLAPEQIRGEPVGPGVDVYALTGVLYHCLTGKPPYPRDDEAAKMWAHLEEPPPCPSQVKPGLPTELDGVVARGMAKNAADRYKSAGELARAAAVAVGLPSQLVVPRPPLIGADETADPSAVTTVPETP